MAFLTVGATNIDCDYGQQAKASFDRLSKKQRAASGRLRVALRAEKKVFVVQTIPVSLATRTTIKGLLNAFQTCSGDLTGSTTCYVELMPADQLSQNWRMNLKLTEQ
jgi:hypothetical protein